MTGKFDAVDRYLVTIGAVPRCAGDKPSTPICPRVRDSESRWGRGAFDLFKTPSPGSGRIAWPGGSRREVLQETGQVFRKENGVLFPLPLALAFWDEDPEAWEPIPGWEDSPFQLPYELPYEPEVFTRGTLITEREPRCRVNKKLSIGEFR